MKFLLGFASHRRFGNGSARGQSRHRARTNLKPGETARIQLLKNR